MSAIYHKNSGASLKGLWTEKFRSDLHSQSNWCRRLNGNDDKVSLSYVPTSIGFSGSSQLTQFSSLYPANEHIFKTFDEVQSVSLVFDECSGMFCDEFILTWTQKVTKMEYLFADQCLPLQKFKLSFIVTGQIDLTERLLKTVRVHWDQGSFILQAGLMLKAFRPIFKPGTTSDQFESCISTLPINSGDYKGIPHVKYLPNEKVNGFGINTISSILTDLPASTSGPAVSTPQLPARSRSINPALMSSLKFGEDLPFDSPLPGNVRHVKSRNILDESVSEETVDQKRRPPQLPAARKLFDEISSNAELPYSPILQPNIVHSKQLQSRIFDESSDNVPRHNQPLTDKNLFESHVFDSLKSDLPAEKKSSVAAGPPPSCPSHFITPEEDLLRDPKGSQPVSSTLSRPGMQGHFKGAAIGESQYGGNRVTSAFPENYRPSTKITFDPNRSQFSLNGEVDSENSSSSVNNSLKTFSKPSFDPNVSQIRLGQDSADGKSNNTVTSTRPSSRIMSPPGGKSTIEL